MTCIVSKKTNRKVPVGRVSDTSAVAVPGFSRLAFVGKIHENEFWF